LQHASGVALVGCRAGCGFAKPFSLGFVGPR
jgi:hypothetical protein